MDANEKLVKDVKVVLSDIEQILNEVKGQTTKEFSEAQETVTEKLEKAKAMLINSEQDLLSKEKVAVEMTDSYARGNTWKLLLVVAIVSFFIGYTMH